MWIVEHIIVKVGRAVGHHHTLTLLDLHTRSARYPRGQRAETPKPAWPNERSRRQQSPDVPLVKLPPLGVLRERDHAVSDRVASGLVTGDREHDRRSSRTRRRTSFSPSISASMSCVTMSSVGPLTAQRPSASRTGARGDVPLERRRSRRIPVRRAPAHPRRRRRQRWRAPCSTADRLLVEIPHRRA